MSINILKSFSDWNLGPQAGAWVHGLESESQKLASEIKTKDLDFSIGDQCTNDLFKYLR